MATLAVVADDVHPATLNSTKPIQELVKFGGTFTRGQVVAKQTSGDKLYIAVKTGTANIDWTTAGIAVTGGVINEWGVIERRAVNLGVTLDNSAPYYVSTTSEGDIVVWADLSALDPIIIVGQPASSAVMALSLENTGLTK